MWPRQPRGSAPQPSVVLCPWLERSRLSPGSAASRWSLFPGVPEILASPGRHQMGLDTKERRSGSANFQLLSCFLCNILFHLEARCAVSDRICCRARLSVQAAGERCRSCSGSLGARPSISPASTLCPLSQTTLAHIIANNSKKHSVRFVTLSATSAKTTDVRDVIKQAQNEKRFFKRKTILFIDEIHRFNKSQQVCSLLFTFFWSL